MSIKKEKNNFLIMKSRKKKLLEFIYQLILLVSMSIANKLNLFLRKM